MDSDFPISHQLSHGLLLSLFPGAGLLDRGFEQAGFCVVRGPDTVFGQSIENFSAPAGHFTGIFGGGRHTLSLKSLRERVQAGERFPEFEWGGCGCGVQS